MITSFGILAHPFMGLLFLAFLSQNVIIIGGVLVIYFALYFWFKKNRTAVHSYLEDANRESKPAGQTVSG